MSFHCTAHINLLLFLLKLEYSYDLENVMISCSTIHNGPCIEKSPYSSMKVTAQGCSGLQTKKYKEVHLGNRRMASQIIVQSNWVNKLFISPLKRIPWGWELERFVTCIFEMWDCRYTLKLKFSSSELICPGQTYRSINSTKFQIVTLTDTAGSLSFSFFYYFLYFPFVTYLVDIHSCQPKSRNSSSLSLVIKVSISELLALQYIGRRDVIFIKE